MSTTTETEDFSLKWFGIPDAKVVAFWKKLEAMPRISKEAHEAWRENQRRIAAMYRLAEQGNESAQRWVEEHRSAQHWMRSIS